MAWILCSSHFWHFPSFARRQYQRTALTRKKRNLSHFLEVWQRVEICNWIFSTRWTHFVLKCVFSFICIFVNMYILSNSCLLSGKLFLSSKILYIFNIFHIVFNNYLYQKRHFSTFSTTFSTAFLTIQNCKVKYHYKKQRLNIHFLYI